MRIALFSTCIVDGMYPRVARATVEILERLGHEVVYPPGQTCCSQMHVNSGYFDDAYPVVKTTSSLLRRGTGMLPWHLQVPAWHPWGTSSP